MNKALYALGVALLLGISIVTVRLQWQIQQDKVGRAHVAQLLAAQEWFAVVAPPNLSKYGDIETLEVAVMLYPESATETDLRSPPQRIIRLLWTTANFPPSGDAWLGFISTIAKEGHKVDGYFWPYNASDEGALILKREFGTLPARSVRHFRLGKYTAAGRYTGYGVDGLMVCPESYPLNR